MSRIRGSFYEQQAANFLNRHGLEIIDRNVQIMRGEIDLIAIDQNTLVFIEVKFRQTDHYGSAAEMLPVKKQLLLIRTAELYLQRHQRYKNMPCRFDLVAICAKPAKMDWIKSAFLIT